jgi:hypothetical protein
VAEATGFAPLSQLTISGTDDLEIDFESAALKSFREFAPQYLPYAELCGIWTGDCEVPGVGSFSFDVEYSGIRNDIAAVWIDSVTFKVGGAPAPVPLPASAMVLVAGLGLLGAAKLRRNA